MSGKIIVGFGLILLLLGDIGFDETLAQPSKGGSAYSVDPELCTLMLRKGKESFTRGRYTEAKELFRKAILADPNSPKGWSYYDLAQMYSVAEQFKNHGRIVQSSAPEQTTEMAQPQPAPSNPSSPGKASAPEPAKKKIRAAPTKKEKP